MYVRTYNVYRVIIFVCRTNAYINVRTLGKFNFGFSTFYQYLRIKNARVVLVTFGLLNRYPVIHIILTWTQTNNNMLEIF